MFGGKKSKKDNVVRAELLFSELNGGNIEENDYLAISTSVLDKFKPEKQFVVYPSNIGISWEERYKVLEAKHGIENGCCRMPNGCWYVAHHKILEECDGAQVNWWFNYCDDSEKFRWWHPKNHIQGGWDPQ